MVDVLTEIIIHCPCDKVSEYAANPDNAPEWYVNIDSAEWQTPKRIEVGSKVAFKAAFLGKQLSYVYQFVEYAPGRKLVMKTADGPFPMETTYTWEPVDGHSTRMTLRNKGNPSGFSMLFSPFMSLMMKNANNKDLKRLKLLLEKRS
ncbi:SRPBCC family protein [Paenibacillus sp. LHD-117]|uniref:SRPBCC family protein n=1 Tax=Paenibacillus sp. LHD-117 TaxID=3071412 RepID=UPI0027E17FBF|nr:SRPBCC family protein [Paenibacillus sp. LHD-117]MDQ6423084.1 SRPBCC family protein [Paenibacillus sp. LHD-117]